MAALSTFQEGIFLNLVKPKEKKQILITIIENVHCAFENASV